MLELKFYYLNHLINLVIIIEFINTFQKYIEIRLRIFIFKMNIINNIQQQN